MVQLQSTRFLSVSKRRPTNLASNCRGPLASFCGLPKESPDQRDVDWETSVLANQLSSVILTQKRSYCAHSMILQGSTKYIVCATLLCTTTASGSSAARGLFSYSSLEGAGPVSGEVSVVGIQLLVEYTACTLPCPQPQPTG